MESVESVESVRGCFLFMGGAVCFLFSVCYRVGERSVLKEVLEIVEGLKIRKIWWIPETVKNM